LAFGLDFLREKIPELLPKDEGMILLDLRHLDSDLKFSLEKQTDTDVQRSPKD